MQQKAAPDGQKASKNFFYDMTLTEGRDDSQIPRDTRIKRSGWAVAQDIGAIIANFGRPDNRTDARLKALLVEYENSDASVKDKIALLEKVVRYGGRKENRKLLASSAKKSEEALIGQIRFLSQKDGSTSSEEKMKILEGIAPDVAGKRKVAAAIKKSRAEQEAYLKEQALMQEVRKKQERIFGFYALFANELDADEYEVVLQSRMQPALYSGLFKELDGFGKDRGVFRAETDATYADAQGQWRNVPKGFSQFSPKNVSDALARLEGPEERAKYLDGLLQKLAGREPALRGSRAEGYLTGQRDWEADSPGEVRRNLGAWLLGVGISSKQVTSQTPDADIRRTLAGVGRDAGLLEEALRTNWGNAKPEEFVSQAQDIFDKYGKAMEDERWRTYEPTLFGLYSESPITSKFWAPVSKFVERYSGELEMAGMGVVSLVQPDVGAALFFGTGVYQIDQAIKNASASQAIMGALMCIPGAGRVVATLGAESKEAGAVVRLADIGASAGMTGTMSYEIWKTALLAGSSYWSLSDVMKIGADAGMMIGLPLASKTFGGGKKRNMVEKTNGLQMDGNRPLEKGNETNTKSSSIGTGHEAKDGQTLTPEKQRQSIESGRRRIQYLEKTIDEYIGLVRERMDIRGNSDAGKLRLKEIEERMNNITAAYARFFKKGLTTLESLDALHEEWTTDASKYKNIRRYSTEDAKEYVKNYQGNRNKVRGVAYRGALSKTDVTATEGFSKAMHLMEKEYGGTPQGKFLQENPPVVLGANVLFPLILARMGEYYPTTDIILVEREGMTKARARSVSVLIHETHHYLGSLGKDGAFNEGYTQLLTEAILEKNGVKSSSVHGSAVEGAYYLEQIVGWDVMNDAYFNGNHARLKAALDEKLGDGTYDQCMSFSYGLLGTVKFRRYVKKAIKKANLGGKEIKVTKWDKKTSWKEREKTQPDRMVEKFETPVATDQTKPDSKTGQASGMDAKAELDKKASIDKIQEIYEKKFGRPFELPKSVAWEKFDVIDADCVEKIIRGSKRAGCAFSVSEYLRIINSPSFSPEYRDLVGVILSNFKKDGDVSIGNGLVKLRNHMEAGRSFGENLQNIRDAPEEFRKKYPHYNRGLADLIINACAMDALEFERPGAVEFLHKNNGIEFFGRYSLETLINQYDNYGKRNPLKPLMVIINPLRDWNGAFYGDIKNIEGLCENMDARIVEVGSAKDAKNEIAKTAGLYGDLISSVWVSGHSTKRTMQLGNTISGLVSGVGIAYGGDLSKYFIPHPSVIVVGCKSGADVIGGMARSASGRYKNALFYAPSSTDAGHIIEYAGTDPAGTPLFDVKWTSEFSNIYEGGKVIAQPNINDRIEERKVAKQTGENAAPRDIEELGNTASEEMAEMLKVGIMHNAKNLAITPRNLAEIILMDINQESSPPALVENLKLVSKSGGEMGRLFDELAKSKKPPQTGPGSESVQMPREPAQIIADMEKNIETTRAALDKVIPLLENQQGGQEMDEFIDLFKFAQDGLDIALSEMEGSTQIRLNNIALTIYDACANSTKNRRISMDVQYYETADGYALAPLKLQDESIFANYNPIMVRGIIENLASNAERYGTSAGRIEIVIGPSDIKIRVSDDGPGLSAGMAARAFDYNTKLENRKEGSSGVGLWYCKWAAEQMGGTIGFTDLGPAYGGKMTTIEVSLPIAKMEQGPKGAGAAETGSPGPDAGMVSGVAAGARQPTRIIDEQGHLIMNREMVAGMAAGPGRKPDDLLGIGAKDRPWLDKRIQADPADASALVMRGVSKLDRSARDIYGAAADAHEAIRRGSEDIGAYYVAYDAESSINNFYLAYRFAERGLKECPNPNPIMRMTLEKKLESLQVSCIKRPEDYLMLRPLANPAKDLHDCVSRAVYYSGKAEQTRAPDLLAKSVENWDAAIGRVENGESFKRMGDSLTLADLYAERAYEYEKWAGLDPANAGEHWSKAARDYKTALELDPPNKRFARKLDEISRTTGGNPAQGQKSGENAEQDFGRFARANHLEAEKTANGYEVRFKTMFVDEDFGLVPSAKMGKFMENYSEYLQNFPDMPSIRYVDGSSAPAIYGMEGFGQSFGKWEDAHLGTGATDYLEYLNMNGLNHSIEARLQMLGMVLDDMGVVYDNSRLAVRLRGSNLVFSIPAAKAGRPIELVVKFKAGMEEHVAVALFKALGRRAHKVVPTSSMTVMDRLEGVNLVELAQSGRDAQGKIRIGDIRPGGKHYESYVDQLFSWMADYNFVGLQDAGPRNFMISADGEGIRLQGLDFEGTGYSKPLSANEVAKLHGIDLSDPQTMALARKSYSKRWAQVIRKFEANKEDFRKAYAQWMDNPRVVKILKANAWVGGPEFYSKGTDGIINVFEQRETVSPKEAWKAFLEPDEGG